MGGSAGHPRGAPPRSLRVPDQRRGFGCFRPFFLPPKLTPKNGSPALPGGGTPFPPPSQKNPCPQDKYAFVGTTSGDVLCVQLQGAKCYKFAGPQKRLPQGILSACMTDEGCAAPARSDAPWQPCGGLAPVSRRAVKPLGWGSHGSRDTSSSA